MNKTNIEWTDLTWNPITGCSKVSEGCKNCYAEKMANRLYKMNNPRYKNVFKVTLHDDLLNVPIKKKKPNNIFVCSMSDLFHEEVPFDYIKKVFDIMKLANWHVFQVLTKRPNRLLEFSKNYKIPDNVWIGTSIENITVKERIDYLKNVQAKTKFLSCEPLLDDISSLDFNGIDWIVVGGESGPNSRPIKKEWVIKIKDICEINNIPFFFKQWGGINKKKNGKELDGKTYTKMPCKSSIEDL